MKTTLVCTMQNKLGALDRVLGMLTHWGFMMERFESRLEARTNSLRVSFTFECPEEKTLEKLIKAINKQVYVLGVEFGGENEAVTPVASIAPSQNETRQKSTPVFVPLHTVRREAHASNSQ